MAAHEFLFELHVSDAGRLRTMLDALAAQLFEQVGYPAAVARELAGELQAAVHATTSRHLDLDITFRAHAGEMEVLVSRHDRQLWRTARRLP